LKPFWIRIHQVCGLAAGLFLSIMGLTGATMSFEDEIMAALSPGIVTVAPPDGPKLSPDVLIARLRQARPDIAAGVLDVDGRREGATLVQFFAPSGERATRQKLYVDPYDARILGPARGAGFFLGVREVHRWLLLPGGARGIGAQITGAAAIALAILAATGLYLRWPMRPGQWRAWFKLDLGRGGRMLYWSLHAKIGTWLMPVYLLSALTGLYWSYDWYRAGFVYVLTGRTAEAPRPAGRRDEPAVPVSLDAAWTAFMAESGGRFRTASLPVPRGPVPEIRIRAVAPDAPNPRAQDEYRIETRTGAIVTVARYAAQTLGEAVAGNVLEVHRGRFFGLAGTIVVAVAAALMPLFAVTGLLLYFGRRRARRRVASAPAGMVAGLRRG
jgi:sulfite reductase (NADPH) flavoprotein alpha-component